MDKVQFIIRNSPVKHVILGYYIDCFKSLSGGNVAVHNWSQLFNILRCGSVDLCFSDDPISFISSKIFCRARSHIFISFEIFEHQLKNTSARNFIRNKFFQIIHWVSLKNADYIIFPSELRRDFFKHKITGLLEKSFVIENFPLRKSLSKTVDHSYLQKTEQFRKSYGKVIVYAGMVHTEDLMTNLLDVVAATPDIAIICMYPKRYHFTERYNFSNILFLFEVPHNLVQNIYEYCDIGLLLYANEPLNVKLCAPVKLYEYLNAGLAVISNDNYSMKQNPEVRFTFQDVKQIVVFCRELDVSEKIRHGYDFKSNFLSKVDPLLLKLRSVR